MALFKKKNKSTEEEAIDVVEETKSDAAEDSVVKADKKEFKISTLAKIKNSLPFINKNAPIIVISMDIYEKIVYVMNIIGQDLTTANVTKLPYKAKTINEEFFEKLQTILELYMKDKPTTDLVSVYVVLPDECVCLDLIQLPTISKIKMHESLNVSVDTLFKNKRDLILKTNMIVTNKQYTTYQAIAIQKSLMSSFYSVLSNCGMYAKYTSYISNCLIDAVLHLQSKYRSSSFMFVDIRKEDTIFAVANKGRTIAHYNLEFGYKILDNNKIAYENLLVNHDLAELTILNAKEKAKSKQLTSIEDYATEEGEVETDAYGRKLPKKTPRSGSAPVTSEEVAYENFRIFTKWILLISETYRRKGKDFEFEFVLINLPERLNYIIDNYNEVIKSNIESNKQLEFRAFNQSLNVPDDLKENLDLYGALYMNSYNKKQVF